MGGSQQAARQDTVISSHQATTNLFHMSDNTKLYQSEPSSADVIQTSDQPASSDLDQVWRCSTEELINAPEEDKLTITQQELVENPAELVRTADVKSPSADPELIRDRSHSLSPEPERVSSSQGRLSLFSGMELITKGRMMCESDTPHTELDKTDRLGGTETVQNSDSSLTCVKTNEVVGSSSCDLFASDPTQTVSAFSFLNF